MSRTRKVKPIWILLEQETVGGSGIRWVVCKSAPRSRQTTTPASTTQFLQAGCPSCRPTNSVKALNCITTSESKGRFFTKRIDSHNESNRIEWNALLDTVKARKLAHYRHFMRKQGSCLENEIMQGTMPGARRRGRPRTAWIDKVKTWTWTLRGRVSQSDRGQR